MGKDTINKKSKAKGARESVPKGNPNRLAALWLAVTIGQNWKEGKFDWNDAFVTGIPKDVNPAVRDTFQEVKRIVEGNPAAFESVVAAWNALASTLEYKPPETQAGIMALAKESAKDADPNPFPAIAGWLHIVTDQNATMATLKQYAPGLSTGELNTLAGLINQVGAARDHWSSDLSAPFKYRPPCPPPYAITAIANFPFPCPGQGNDAQKKSKRKAKKRQ